jgi:hypothetical protein
MRTLTIHFITAINIIATMKKLTLFLFLLLVVSLVFHHSTLAMAFLHAGGIALFVVILVASVLFFAERVRRY